MTLSPSTLTYLLGLSLFRSYLSSHIVWVSWVEFPCYYKETQTHSQLSGPLALTIFLPLFYNFPPTYFQEGMSQFRENQYKTVAGDHNHQQQRIT